MYGISEAARRSGFTPSALRYYEDAGVVPPPGRSAAGYRTYDDAAIARLGFVGRAKQLGCTLEEISALVALWDGERCEPVQRELRSLVERKVAETEQRARELTAFAGELRAAVAVLDAHTPDAACDDRCGCAGPVEAAPIACTLDGSDVPARVSDWEAALATVVAREPLPDGLRLSFGDGAPVADVAALAAAERRCCSFFRFALTVDERGAALEVRAPDEGRPVLDALFG